MKNIVTTIACMLVLLAGSAAWGQTPQVNTLALQETLNASGGIALGPDGMLYVSNFVRENFDFNSTATFGNKIYKVNPADGSVALFVEGSSLRGPFGMAFDHDGNLIVTNMGFSTLSSISPEGVVSRIADIQNGIPTGVAVAADSSILVAKCGQPGQILRFAPGSNTPTVLLEGNACPLGLALDENGTIYSSYQAGNILKTPPEGGSFELLAPVTPGFSVLNHLVYSSADKALYATALQDHRIWRISLADGIATVLAGTGSLGTADGSADQATFINPNGLAVSTDGTTIYVNQTLSNNVGNPNSIRMITDILDMSPVADEDEAEVPAGFALTQNYPNPFNPSTRIGFQLPQAQHVTLVVYDLLGRPVATLVEGLKPAGQHEAVFDAHALPSGIYVYRLQTERFSTAKVMTLLK